MFFCDHKDVVRQVDNFKRLGIPFKVIAGNSRMYIYGEMGDYMTGNNKIPMRELVYIDLVKKYIIKNKLYETLPKLKNVKIDYYKHSKNISSLPDLKNCYEIDLKSAYWEMANKLGLLNAGLYKKASTINPKTGELYMSKLTRLAAIGSLARKYRIYKYDEDGNKTRRRERSKLTEHLWNNIVLEVGKVMNNAIKAAGDDFLFFWVDAIFVKSKKSRDAVMKAFKKDIYEFKVLPCEKVEFREKIIVYCAANKKKPIRRFPYAPIKRKKMSRRSKLIFKIN